MFAVGAALAAAIIAVDQTLARRGANFRTPVLAVAVGLYLPLELSVPIFIGGLVSYLVGRRLAARGDTSASRGGILFASGLITGEALMGILLAIPFAAAQSAEILLIAPDTPAFTIIANVLGVALFAVFAFWLYRVATSRR
jgi:uncharacterized oligopeptide transporter (OPT) family protein